MEDNELKQKIEQHFREAIQETIDKKFPGKIQIHNELQLIQSGLFDSVGFLDLLSDIEETFNIEVDFGEKDPEEFLSFSGFLGCVKTGVA